MTMDNKQALDEILRSVFYLLQEGLKNVTQCYDGIVLSKQAEKWEIQYNGKKHLISYYGTNSPTVGKMVKVFIPQGNDSLAFFI